jgi:hypothetical protein
MSNKFNFVVVQLLFAMAISISASAEPTCYVRPPSKELIALVATPKVTLREQPAKDAAELITLSVGDEIALLNPRECKVDGSWTQIDSRHCLKGTRDKKSARCQTYKGWIESENLSTNEFQILHAWRKSSIDVSIGDYAYRLDISEKGDVVYHGDEARKCGQGEKGDENEMCWKPLIGKGGHLYRYKDLVVIRGTKIFIEPLFVSETGRLCSTYCKECCEE